MATHNHIVCLLRSHVLMDLLQQHYTAEVPAEARHPKQVAAGITTFD
jgi:hypothetical protein